MPKLVLLIADGLGDRAIPAFGGMTPLEAAATPSLDRLAREGACGLLDMVAPGVPGGSDTGHLSLLGYDPYASYTGRGPFEAAGVGLEVAPGDVAFRCNFATLREGRVVDRRAGRISEGTAELLAGLDGLVIEDVTVRVKASIAHRAALVLKGPGLGGDVSDVDPHELGAPPQEAKGGDEAGTKTARILNEFVRRAILHLRAHPINRKRQEQGLLPASALLPRGAGRAPDLQPFESRHALRAAGVGETGLVLGVCRYLGMATFHPKGATGGLDSDANALIEAALSALESFDFVLVNYKAPDVAGHDGLHEEKKRVIEAWDQAVGKLIERAQDDWVVAATGDHATPCQLKEHAGDPVPLLIWGSGVLSDQVDRFHERACARGGLGRLHGTSLVTIMRNCLGMHPKHGA